MSAFAENPFFFLVDNPYPFFPLNVLDEPQKIVELTDVACNTKRSFNVPSENGSTFSPKFIPKKHFTNGSNNIHHDMHADTGRYKKKHNDYYIPDDNGCRGMYCSRQSRKSSCNSKASWMNRRNSPTMYDDYRDHSSRKKYGTKKTNKMDSPERDIWSQFWSENIPANYMDEYTILRNQYESMRDSEYENQGRSYHHRNHRAHSGGQSSRGAANTPEGLRREETFLSRERRARRDSAHLPVYNENFYQQRLLENFYDLDPNDYSSERSDDLKRGRSLRNGSKIRSRTYSPPMNRRNYEQQLLRNHYDDDTYLSTSNENFAVDDPVSARKNMKDMDGNIDRDISDSQISAKVRAGSSVNVMFDTSRSSMEVDCETPWDFMPYKDERRRRRSTLYDDERLSSSHRDYLLRKDSSKKNSAGPSASKSGYQSFAKKNLSASSNDIPLRHHDSSYSIFTNSNSNENGFATLKTVCTETNTDPADFHDDETDAKVLFSAEASENSIHTSVSCNVEKECQASKRPNSANLSEANTKKRIIDDNPPKQPNEEVKLIAITLAQDKTAVSKPKSAKSKPKSAEIHRTSSRHSAKSGERKAKADGIAVSKLPVRIGARNKSRHPKSASPSSESCKRCDAVNREKSRSPEDRSIRARTRPRVVPTILQPLDEIQSKQKDDNENQSSHQNEYSKPVEPPRATKNDTKKKSHKTLKESKLSIKSQQKRPPIDSKTKRESKFINLLRKSKLK